MTQMSTFELDIADLFLVEGQSPRSIFRSLRSLHISLHRKNFKSLHVRTFCLHRLSYMFIPLHHIVHRVYKSLDQCPVPPEVASLIHQHSHYLADILKKIPSKFMELWKDWDQTFGPLVQTPRFGLSLPNSPFFYHTVNISPSINIDQHRLRLRLLAGVIV